MSCGQRHAIDRALSPAELAAFCAHARTCPDCEVLLDRVASAYRTLRGDVVEPMTSLRKARLLAEIESRDAEGRSRHGLWLLAPALAALAAVLVAVHDPAGPRILRGEARSDGVVLSEGDAVGGRTLVVNGRTEIGFGRSVASFDGPAELSPAVAPLEALAIERGFARFQVDLASGERFVVTTPLASFAMIAGRFTLDVSPDRVRIEVGEGSVEITPADGGRARTIAAPRSATLEREAPVAPASVHPPPKAIPPPAPRVDGASPPRAAPMVAPAAIVRSQQERLEEALQVVIREPARARDLAEEVLDEKPAPALEIGALLVLADAYRRTGELGAASVAYHKVAAHPDGHTYAEESLLRRAQILVTLGRRGDALEALAQAERRFATGALLPERAVLGCQIHLDEKDPERAAAILERAGDERTLSVMRMRVDVAEALADPVRARSLVTPVLSSNVPPGLRARAESQAQRRSH
jgi:hypothetical protein